MLSAAPTEVVWNYTNACNFNCSHCYSRASRYPAELSTREYLQIAEQIIEASVFSVGFGGGEPLIRRDCIDLVSVLCTGGVRTTITTNGWLVDPALARRLASARLTALVVSLDSPDASEHDRIRAQPGSFERAVAAVRAAVDAGVEVNLSTVVMTPNVDHVERFAMLARGLGVTALDFKRFRGAGNDVRRSLGYRLEASAEERFKQAVAEITRFADLEVRLIYETGPGVVDTGCPCGVRSLCIRPNGDVSPCTYVGAVIGRLPGDRLETLWRTSPLLRELRQRRRCLAAPE